MMADGHFRVRQHLQTFSGRIRHFLAAMSGWLSKISFYPGDRDLGKFLVRTFRFQYVGAMQSLKSGEELHRALRRI